MVIDRRATPSRKGATPTVYYEGRNPLIAGGVRPQCYGLVTGKSGKPLKHEANRNSLGRKAQNEAEGG